MIRAFVFHLDTIRVTDEVLIAETMVWPNLFLMNVFFALKGSKLFIIITHHTQLSCHFTGDNRWLLDFRRQLSVALICLNC